jgi:hypothetical protein
MRERLTADRLRAFMRALGRDAEVESRVYITGGATAVLLGWRESTLDADIAIRPDHDSILRAIPRLKEELHINVELAAPSDFIPHVPGWDSRSRFIVREGKLAFHHYDFYSQALAKIERSHEIDVADVRQMIESGLVERPKLLELFEAIEPELYRYPAIDPRRFRRAVLATLHLQ